MYGLGPTCLGIILSLPICKMGPLRQVWDDGLQISSFLLFYVTLWRTVCRAYAIHAFPLLQHPNLLAYIHLIMIHANSTYVSGIIRYDGAVEMLKDSWYRLSHLPRSVQDIWRKHGSYFIGLTKHYLILSGEHQWVQMPLLTFFSLSDQSRHD
jgi:hypothetical protein